MSARTDQYNCERVQIAQLALQPVLMELNQAGGIVHFDKDTQTSKDTKNRIVVQAMPRTVKTYGHNPATPFIFSSIVRVTVYVSEKDQELLDTYVAAVHGANTGTCPAAVVTLITSLFGSRGFEWHDTSEGERNDTDNERQASQAWEAVFGA